MCLFSVKTPPNGGLGGWQARRLRGSIMQMGVNLLFIQLSVPSNWKQLPSGPGENHVNRTGGLFCFCTTSVLSFIMKADQRGTSHGNAGVGLNYTVWVYQRKNCQE